jgi:hypothetical protein
MGDLIRVPPGDGIKQQKLQHLHRIKMIQALFVEAFHQTLPMSIMN